MFGLRYFGEFRSKYKQLYWRIEIAERGYVGTMSELAMRGDSPLSITWERRGDEFYTPVKGSEATINVVCVSIHAPVQEATYTNYSPDIQHHNRHILRSIIIKPDYYITSATSTSTTH